LKPPLAILAKEPKDHCHYISEQINEYRYPKDPGEISGVLGDNVGC
jgi:hypothetical protein